jgi:DNA repair exonuclease SbcCD nuclease subunit
VLYAGSIERTSWAEAAEKKGYLWVKIKKSRSRDQPMVSWRFCELPARPMIRLHLHIEEHDRRSLTEFLQRSLSQLDPQSVVKIQIEGMLNPECYPVLRAAALREISPPGMNISLRYGSKRHPFPTRYGKGFGRDGFNIPLNEAGRCGR